MAQEPPKGDSETNQKNGQGSDDLTDPSAEFREKLESQMDKITKVNVEDIYSLYLENVFAFNEKYHRGVYYVTGVVDNITVEDEIPVIYFVIPMDILSLKATHVKAIMAGEIPGPYVMKRLAAIKSKDTINLFCIKIDTYSQLSSISGLKMECFLPKL
jgi:hypothetical protein